MFSKKTTKGSNSVFKVLAANNVKKSARDYMIYFLTISFGVCLFYTFNSIGDQFTALGMEDTLSYLAFSQGMMFVISLFICLIMGFLIVYANRFLMKRRRRELGIYITLGMNRKDIAKILRKETIIIGSGALVTGILSGVLVSQVLSILTAKLLGIPLTNFRFVFSFMSMISSIILFVILFCLVHVFNVDAMKKSKLIDLLHYGKKNETFKANKVRDIFGILISIGLMAFGYYKIASLDSINMRLVFGIILIGVGTFIFFMSFSGILLIVLERIKTLYYKGINMYVIRQIAGKIKSANVSVSVICLLLFLSVSTISGGLGISHSIINGLEEGTPYDVTIRRFGQVEDGYSYYDTIVSNGVPLDNYVDSYAELNIYYDETLKATSFLVDNGKKYKNGVSDLPVLKVSEYNNIRLVQGLEPIVLGNNEFAINYFSKPYDELYKDFQKTTDGKVKVNGTTLEFSKNGIYQMAYGNSNVLVGMDAVIVPDEVAYGLKTGQTLLNCQYIGNKDEAEKVLFDASRNHKELIPNFDSKKLIRVDVQSTNMTLSYIAIYLGTIFMICAGAVLALQQLSEAIDQKDKYSMLKKLGVKRSDMEHSMLTQILVYFGTPLLLASIHFWISIKAFYRLIDNITGGVMMKNIVFACVILLLMYGTYFIATFMGSKRVATGE